MPVRLRIACLCGSVARTLTARHDGNDPGPIPIALCHCDTCRHTSGVLCTSYCPVAAPQDGAPASLDMTADAQLAAYAASPSTTCYFCRTCGCQVFRRRARPAESDDSTRVAAHQALWEVATGLISDERQCSDSDSGATDKDDASPRLEGTPPVLAYTRHDHVADTGDGGLAVWLRTVDGHAMDGLPTATWPPPLPSVQSSAPESRTVPASCHCNAIQFSVRPPDHDPANSCQPHSGFCDLLVPFADPASAGLATNPEDVKWWLRPPLSSQSPPGPSRYLAGTCACRSCRLATGFEVQTWAFVPRANIILPTGDAIEFTPPATASAVGGCLRLPMLASYRSSPGVERNFCRCCGATVFWHDVWRPDLIDVSVGLLRCNDGMVKNRPGSSRFDILLDWCTTRVSFAEEAPRGRKGLARQRGVSLVSSLESGMSAAS